MTAQPDGSALFGCNASDVTWMMSCDGDKWTGVERTCDPKTIKTGASRTHDDVSGSSVTSYLSESHWLIVVFVGVIAMSLACVIFFVGLIIIRR